jgi:hypothetical protein
MVNHYNYLFSHFLYRILLLYILISFFIINPKQKLKYQDMHYLILPLWFLSGNWIWSNNPFKSATKTWMRYSCINSFPRWFLIPLLCEAHHYFTFLDTSSGNHQYSLHDHIYRSYPMVFQPIYQHEELPTMQVGVLQMRVFCSPTRRVF